MHFCAGQVPAAVETLGATQDSGVITAEVGQTVILKCFCGEDSVTFLSWYQQILGGKPVIVSTRMRHHMEASVYPPFEGRFQVESGETINHLKVSDVRLSDSAMYYCGILEFNLMEFGQGVLLHVRTSLPNIRAVVYQPALELVQLGDSVNLSCAVYSGKCAEEQSLYWLRHVAAQPAIMYQNAGHCVTGPHTRNCTLSLSIKSVNTSDAGTYYCALASCGEIVFGNGTTVQIKGE